MEGKTSFSIFKRLISLMVIFLFVAIGVSPVMAATPLSDYHHVFINVANDDGVKYDLDGALYGSGNNNTYYIKADGGGVNELHITTDASNLVGQATTSTAQSGTFYVTNTGGRGHDEDILLLLSVQAPIPDDFSVHIKSSGYTNWTLVNPNGCTNSALPTDYQYVEGAVDATFTREDFIYGNQTWKPGPSQQPLYYGQSIYDASTDSYLMFIDLKVGNLKSSSFPSLIDGGASKVEFTFTNLATSAAFNGYGWALYANQCQGISWTNDLTGASSSGVSGYRVIGIPYAAFSADQTSGTAPLTVQFTDQSISNATLTYAWDFDNDGVTDSPDPSPSHTYSTAGTYIAKLTVSNSDGSDTAAQTITVSSGVTVLPLPGLTGPPTDPDNDGLYEDMSGNGAASYTDVVLFFKNLDWITENEPVSAFDFSGNGAIAFKDIVVLFKEV
jgi:PKD repeat protein